MWDQGAEESKTAGSRACSGFSDISIFESLFPWQSMGILLAFLQKTCLCGLAKGSQRKRSKLTSR